MNRNDACLHHMINLARMGIIPHISHQTGTCSEIGAGLLAYKLLRGTDEVQKTETSLSLDFEL